MTEGQPRTVFLGTPETAVPALRALHELSRVVLVVTRPDRPRGRSGRPQAPPVKHVAEELGLPVAQTADRAGLAAVLAEAAPLDLGLVTAYGMILPPSLLDLPRLGMVNIHFSLLPRWRGAAPVQAAIRAGDEVTGVTLMQMDAGLDTGPILARETTPIGGIDTAGSLAGRLAEMASSIIRRHFHHLLEGRLQPVPQDESAATYAPALRADDRLLDLSTDAWQAARQVRSLAPRPGVVVSIDGAQFRLLEVEPDSRPLEPGVLLVEGEEVRLGTGRGSLRILTLQPPGRREMSAAAWLHGRR